MHQAELFARRRARDGIRRAGDHADELFDNWVRVAAIWLCQYALAHDGPFLIEDARKGFTVPPPDARAWGAATREAVRLGAIVRAGYAPANSSNRSPKCLWRATRERLHAPVVVEAAPQLRR